MQVDITEFGEIAEDGFVQKSKNILRFNLARCERIKMFQEGNIMRMSEARVI